MASEHDLTDSETDGPDGPSLTKEPERPVSAELVSLLLDCAHELRNELLAAPNPEPAPATMVDDRQYWRPPALYASMRLGNLLTSDLSRLLYLPPDLVNVPSEADIVRAWGEAVPTLIGGRGAGKAVVGLFKELFPTVPITTSVDGPLVPAAQFLVAASWCVGTLVLQPGSISLSLGGGEKLGYSQRHVEWADGGYTLLRRRARVQPLYRVSAPTGALKLGRQLTGTLFRFLTASLPYRVTTLDYLFSVAVHAGSDVESQLYSVFDMTRTWGEGRHELPRPWAAALRACMRADEVVKLLPEVDPREVRKLLARRGSHPETEERLNRAALVNLYQRLKPAAVQRVDPQALAMLELHQQLQAL